jgi:hypothetical protein
MRSRSSSAFIEAAPDTFQFLRKLEGLSDPDIQVHGVERYHIHISKPPGSGPQNKYFSIAGASAGIGISLPTT